MEMLKMRTWPGNIRQLENALEYAFAISKSKIITPDILPTHIRQQVPDIPCDNNIDNGDCAEKKLLKKTMNF